MRHITSSDRRALVKLASDLPKGDLTRRAILAGLKKTAGTPQDSKLLAKVSEATENTLLLVRAVLKKAGWTPGKTIKQSAAIEYQWQKPRYAITLGGWHGTGKWGAGKVLHNAAIETEDYKRNATFWDSEVLQAIADGVESIDLAKYEASLADLLKKIASAAADPESALKG